VGLFIFGRRKNGQRYSDSGGGRSSGDRGFCDLTFQDEEESSSVAGQLVARFGASALPGPGIISWQLSCAIGGIIMVLLSNTSTSPHKLEVGSPYCSDPKCVYCQDLRAVQAQMRDGKPVTSSGKTIGA
jgi:hypothetical protein